MLGEAEYLQLADECLARVATWIDGLDADEIDYSTRDGMVSLEFPDGARFVLNRQGPARQMWFAAVDQAWHYNWDAVRGMWVDDRDGHEFFANLVATVGKKVGHPVAP